MGNRAVIITKENFENNGVGVYLHWNGGKDSVQAFLKYCELKGYRSPSQDCYGWARLCQVIGNFFGGSTSIGIDVADRLDCDNWDNGTYIIDGWEIVDRKYFEGHEQDEYDLNKMLLAIDERQPKREQLGKELILAKEVLVSKLKVGDMVFMQEYDGNYEKCEVMGFGEDKYINGCDVKDIPYVKLYDHDGDYSWNINNYVLDKVVRVINEDPIQCKGRV